MNIKQSTIIHFMSIVISCGICMADDGDERVKAELNSRGRECLISIKTDLAAMATHEQRLGNVADIQISGSSQDNQSVQQWFWLKTRVIEENNPNPEAAIPVFERVLPDGIRLFVAVTQGEKRVRSKEG